MLKFVIREAKAEDIVKWCSIVMFTALMHELLQWNIFLRAFGTGLLPYKSTFFEEKANQTSKKTIKWKTGEQ